MNVHTLEVKDFYALATLGLNPDGTSAEEKKRVVSVPAPAIIVRKKESA